MKGDITWTMETFLKCAQNAPRESVENDRDQKGLKGLATTRHNPDKRDKAANIWKNADAVCGICALQALDGPAR